MIKTFKIDISKHRLICQLLLQHYATMIGLSPQHIETIGFLIRLQLNNNHKYNGYYVLMYTSPKRVSEKPLVFTNVANSV